MGIANYITLLRISLVPIFMALFYLPFYWADITCAVLFALAALTDWLDGFVARKLGQVSSLGRFLDPVADKLIVAIALVLLVAEHKSGFLAIPAAIIVGREIVVSALREWMAELGKRTSIAVSYIGKAKTFIQMLAILLLLAFKADVHPYLNLIGHTSMYLAAILTLWSMIIYIRASWSELLLGIPITREEAEDNRESSVDSSI